MGIEENLGNKIRKARISNGLTLAQLSKKSNISVSMLSKIENARVSSPVAVYANIAKALQLKLGDLFYDYDDENNKSIYLVRSEDQRIVTKVPNYTGLGIAFNKSNKKFEPFIHIYHPNIKKAPDYQHDNEELIFVIEGKLEFKYDKITYVLNKGDCVYFDSKIMHSARALGNKPAKAFVVEA